MEAHTNQGPYAHPRWERRAPEGGDPVHALLERAARLHQSGELDKAVQAYKSAIKKDTSNGEAYASLGKCLSDQGKYELANKAIAKATAINNEHLKEWALF